ncbi:MAG: hypothetical protein U9N34_09675 [Candidatus Cloacimonadota bacterium]|nr:hypothetical protein [Candidatus Cloacimonadota bacterium]
MTPDICRYEGKKVLLVEGKNDCHVVLALFSKALIHTYLAWQNEPGETSWSIYNCTFFKA